MNTLIQDNVNPIEKLERTMLIVAQTIHQLPPQVLLKPEQVQNVQQFSPNVFPKLEL